MNRTHAGVCVLLAALLAGCGGQASGTTSFTPPAGQASAAVSAAGQPQPSAPAPAGAASSFPPGVLENYELTRTLPEGPYTPFAEQELAAQRSDWFHFLDPALMAGAEGIVPQPVLMLRLGETPGSVALVRGVFETDARAAGFMGSYEYLEDGTIEAMLAEMVDLSTGEGPYIGQGGQTFVLQIKLEHSAEEDLAVVTFTGVEQVENEAFRQELAPWLDGPLAFVRF